jgi:hypothetical protein
MKFTLEIEGEEALSADLYDIAEDLSHIPTIPDISKKYASVAASLAPYRTGALSKSIKPFKSDTVAGASSDLKYAATINYGSAKRGIPASLFMQKADTIIQNYILETLSEGIQDIIDEKGLGG